jgi:hypothetical protein
MGTGHAADTAAEVFQAIGLQTLTIPFTAPIAEHVHHLQQFVGSNEDSSTQRK